MPSKVRVTIFEQEYTATVDGNRVVMEGVSNDFVVRSIGGGRVVATHADTHLRGIVARTPAGAWVGAAGAVDEAQVETAGRRARPKATGDDGLRPPMPATVVRIATSAGSAVAAGDVLIVLEAMKMELPIRAPRAGVVKAVNCREGELVQPSTVLVELD